MPSIEAYDVLQVSNDAGKTWYDYATIRTPNEIDQSMKLVDRTKGQETRYRITRAGRVVYPR